MSPTVREGSLTAVYGPGGRYLLDERQQDAYDEADKKYASDDAFWRWFRAFVKKEELQPQWEAPRRYYYDAWGLKDTSEARRLALALRPVSATVHAVQARAERYSVELSSGEGLPRSYTDLAGLHVVVSPVALLDTKLPLEEQIDITAAFGLHEAGHTEHSVGVWDTVKHLTPKPIVASICNLLEDPRVERLIGEDFPGFAPLFDKALEYIWGRWDDVHAPADLNDVLEDRLQLAINAIKWPSKLTYLSPDAATEARWWTALNEEYQTGRATMLECVRLALDHLKRDFDLDKPEPEGGAEEPYDGAAGVKKGKPDQKPVVPGKDCYGMPESPLAPMLAKEVKRLVEEDYREGKLKPQFNKMGGGAQPPIDDTRPSGHGPVPSFSNDLKNRLKSAFVFRAKNPEWTSRLLKSGEIDDDELWRVGDRDYRVFSQRNIEVAPDADVTLLIDCSGSMGGVEIENAARLAALMLEVLDGTPGVSVRVRGHTGDGSYDGMAWFRLWDQGDPKSRLGAIQNLRLANNYDGWAISYAVQELLSVGQPDNQKILIVLSDGEPAAHDYGGEMAEKHVRSVTDWAERNGVFVVQIAVNGGLDAKAQAAMFKHWIPYTTDAKVPAALVKVLSKAL